MTEELKKKAWKYSDKICGWDKTQMFDYLVDAYIAGYTDAQNTITQCNRMALKTDNTETFKNALNKIADLEQQNANLQTMLQAEREVRCNEEYLKKVTELEAQIERLKGDLELWESGACRATNLDKCGVVEELKAQIEKMKKYGKLLQDICDVMGNDPYMVWRGLEQRVLILWDKSEEEKGLKMAENILDRLLKIKPQDWAEIEKWEITEK